jgi:hypothetical protein
MILALFAGNAFAVDKKPDLRQGKKAVDEKFLESMTSDTPSRKTISHGNRAGQDRSSQLESKKSRQFQEERPVTAPYYHHKKQ